MNKFFTTDEVYKDRLDICRSCIYYFKLTGQCKRCLCFMKVKARLAPMACPEKYWNKTTTIETPEGLPEEIIEEVKKLYPDIKNGKAKNQEVKKRMIELANEGYITATDLADHMVRELNYPFRKAYTQTAKIINYAEENKKKLNELKLEEIKKIEPKIYK